MQDIIAGVPINKEMLLRAKSEMDLKDCLKYIILGYWSPEKYKYLGFQKPKGISDAEYKKITFRECDDILSKYSYKKSLIHVRIS